MSLATRCPTCGTIFRVVQDQLKVSEGWVRCGQCHEVFHGIEALFDLDSDPALAGRRAAPRPPAAPPPTRVFAEQRASAPIPMPTPAQAPPAPAPSPIAIPARPPAPVSAPPPSVPATPSAFGSPSFPPTPPPIRPGYTGFTPATRPMTPPAAPVPPASPERSPIPPIATRGTIAPRFAARLAEESARVQPPAPAPVTSAAAPMPAAPVFVPEPAAAPVETPLVTPIAVPPPAPSAAQLAAEFAAAPAAPATPVPAATPEPAPIGAATPPSRPVAEPEEDDPRAGPPTLASMLPEDAGEWPPRRKKRVAEPTSPSTSTELALVDRTKDPRFLREARSGARWRRPWVRAVLGVALLLLIVAAVGQVAWPMRDTLAARWPVTRPAWDWLCQQADCRIEAPRAIASLALDGSSLTRTDTEHVLLFSADLHNRADHEVRVPSFDVTFMDLNGEIVARKVLTPEQIGIHQAALPAEGELHVHARLQVGSLPASGFQADLFYP